MKDLHIISVLVSNKSGALTRISGLFARRGFNIESLSVCTTENPALSRMTITSSDDEAILQQIVKQLNKLYDVVKVTELSRDSSVARELLLIKVRALPDRREALTAVCDRNGAKIVDVAPESMIIEYTADPDRVDGLLAELTPFGIVEMTRTGLSALLRGKSAITDL